MMAYQDGAQGGVGVGSRYLGEGFRQEADFRDGTSAMPMVPAAVIGPTVTGAEARPAAGRAPNLDLVFDDPAVGEPGRDRMLVHGLWELMLAVVVAGVGYLLLARHGDAIDGGLRGLLIAAAAFGLLASAGALALRAATPNLAVGGVATAVALYFGHNTQSGVLRPLVVVIGAAAVIGAVQGLVIVGLHVPGWAASIGVGMVLLVWSNRQAPVETPAGYDPLPYAYWWFGGFCAISVVACLIGTIPAIRRNFGRFRPVADPGQRRGMAAAMIALGATVVSSALSGLAGSLLVVTSGGADPADGFELTALALGAALLGGTSAFGRRGGIFGTVLAALLVTEIMIYIDVATTGTWPVTAFAAAAIGLGLAVTRMVERFGRPDAGPSTEDAHEWESRRWRTDDDDRPWHTSTAASVWAGEEAWGPGEG